MKNAMTEHPGLMTLQGQLGKDKTASPPKKRTWRYFGLIIALYAVISLVWQADPVEWYVWLAGVVLMALCLLPSALWYAGGRCHLPMVEFVFVSYGLSFATPVFLQPHYLVLLNVQYFLENQALLAALCWAIFGVAVLMISYYLVHKSRLANALPHFDLPIKPHRMRPYLVLGLGIGLSLMFLRSLNVLPSADSSLGSIISLLVNQAYVAIVLFADNIYRSPSPNRSEQIVLFAAVGAASLLGLTTGLLENMMLPLVALVLVIWYRHKRLPWILLLIGLVAFLVLNNVKSAYRLQAWSESGANLGLGDRVGLWADLSQQLVSNVVSDTASTETSVRQATSRFDLLHRFAYVLQVTPDILPYFEGKTYDYFLVAFVPRVLWPDKPDAGDATHLVDVTYGFLFDFQTSSASISVGHLAEGYANFGIFGIFLIMSFQGALFAVLDRVFNNETSEGGLAIYVSQMIFLLNGIGSSMVIWFGGLLQYTVINTLLLLPFTGGLLTEKHDNKLAVVDKLSHKAGEARKPPV